MNSTDVPPGSDSNESHGLSLPTRGKEKRTAEVRAMMILQDLSKVDGCPERGVAVTVYGLERLKRLYDVLD
jgi:hypothetical protein